ncbi:MAG: hypothetical protein A2017_18600 [Lentisphaerae bacterium GWF2_44_16]|nr:MAG: hypothetical protein A2017_18600 [Lentisphaerae bacterium GWF2_44_16]
MESTLLFIKASSLNIFDIRQMITIIREYSYAFAALSPSDGCLESLIYSRADSGVMPFFLKQIADEFPNEHVAIFMDKAAWHTTGKLLVPDRPKTSSIIFFGNNAL